MDADRHRPAIERPIATGILLILSFFAIRALVDAVGILLLGFLAILLAVLLHRPLEAFSRVLPRVLALLLTLAILATAVTAVAIVGIPILTTQANQLVGRLPVALERIEAFSTWLVRTRAVPRLDSMPSVTDRLVHEGTLLIGKAVPFAVSVVGVATTAFAVFILSLFLAYSPSSYRALLRSLVPRPKEPLFDEAWSRVGTALQNWTLGILGAMLTMGVCTAVGLALAGIEGWFLLAIITFVGTFIPYVGAIASAVPGLLMGLSQSPAHFLYALVVYIGVHVVEGYIVEPLIMRHAVRLRPATLLFWQLLMAALFGIPGIIVATPLLACIEVLVNTFYVERRLGKVPPEE